MTDTAFSRRAMCAACLRPCKTCICRFVAPVSSDVELVVLQHPLEVSSAKGSARLLHLSVAGSRMVTGESFEPAALHELLYEGDRRPILLYPETPGERSVGMEPPPTLDPEWLDKPETLRVVVLDGTWRKSRKMLYLNRLLHELPRLALTDMPASRYVIRQAHAPDQLSTLEAACYALGGLEGNPQKFQPILGAFDAFVNQYITAMRGTA